MSARAITPGAFGAGFLVKLALKEVMADKEEQEAAVRESDCDWTIVRPATLTFKRPRMLGGQLTRFSLKLMGKRDACAEWPGSGKPASIAAIFTT